MGADLLLSTTLGTNLVGYLYWTTREQGSEECVDPIQPSSSAWVASSIFAVRQVEGFTIVIYTFWKGIIR